MATQVQRQKLDINPVYLIQRRKLIGHLSLVLKALELLLQGMVQKHLEDKLQLLEQGEKDQRHHQPICQAQEDFKIN